MARTISDERQQLVTRIASIRGAGVAAGRWGRGQGAHRRGPAWWATRVAPEAGNLVGWDGGGGMGGGGGTGNRGPGGGAGVPQKASRPVMISAVAHAKWGIARI